MRVAVLALFVVLLASSAAAMTPVEIKRDYGGAVVTITTYTAAEDAVGLGSGFIVDPSGVIVTCYHVINGAYPAVVKLLNGASFQNIWVLHCDSANDVAVIKVKGNGLPTVKLADSDGVEIGERVVAIGNPKGLENTISDGLLSGVRESDEYRLLQISAPISPGSSGGPVFNSNGRVIGIASATLRDGQNLNFCVPIDCARAFVGQKPVLTLEDFARGIREPVTEAGPGPSAGRGLYLQNCVDPLVGILAACDEYKAGLLDGLGTSNPADARRVVAHRLAYVKVKAENALQRLDGIQPPDRELAAAQEGFADAARKLAAGADMMGPAVAGPTGYAMSTGSAMITEAAGGLRPYVKAFARAYLDEGRLSRDVATRLPATFDRLPATFSKAIQDLALEDSTLNNLRLVAESAGVRRFGFAYNLEVPGVVVESAEAGTPAGRAGLRRGDVIVTVSDTLPTRNLWDWIVFLANQPVGDAFSLDILRGGQKVKLRGSLVRSPR